MRNKIEHHDKMDQFLHQDLIVGLDYNAQELQQGSKKKSNPNVSSHGAKKSLTCRSLHKNSRWQLAKLGLSHFLLVLL